MRWTTLLLAAAFTAWAPNAKTAVPVDLALVLLNDVSQSMDGDEYALVKEGYRAAFSDPEVIAAIQNTGGIAVAYVEFSGVQEIALVKGWDIITDAQSAQAFGEAVAVAPRTAAGETALAASLRRATLLLEDSGFATARRVIDVASDHPHDGGRSASARDAAVEAGITINALPIISNDPIGTFDGHMSYTTAQWGLGGITGFYNLNVIGGPGSFLIEASGIEAFGAALKRKLLLELIASR